MTDRTWTVEALASSLASSGETYLEFLRSGRMSAGLYSLPEGAVDPQTPHTEDEVYYVLSGRASIRIGPELFPVRAGTVVFVEANAEHRFEDIAEDLEVLVVFAPPEQDPTTP